MLSKQSFLTVNVLSHEKWAVVKTRDLEKGQCVVGYLPTVVGAGSTVGLMWHKSQKMLILVTEVMSQPTMHHNLLGMGLQFDKCHEKNIIAVQVHPFPAMVFPDGSVCICWL